MNLEMVCTCSIDGVREVEARRLRIFQRMALASMSDLATAIVMSLAFDFGCDAYLSADHWFGLSIETPLVTEDVYIECDHPADGLAAVWEVLADKFPERVTVRTSGPITLTQDVGRTSNALFAVYEAAKTKATKHYATHGGDYKMGCDECDANMNAYVDAHSVLDSAWGSDSLNQAIKEAYS